MLHPLIYKFYIRMCVGVFLCNHTRAKYLMGLKIWLNFNWLYTDYSEWENGLFFEYFIVFFYNCFRDWVTEEFLS